MPLLLTESLDATRRELTHQHIETCPGCNGEWLACKETWLVLGDLPDVEVPPHVKSEFLGKAGLAADPAPATGTVVPFHRRPSVKWLAQAAAVVVLVGGSYFAGHRAAPRIERTPATIDGVALAQGGPLALAETRVVSADAISPDIQGRPNIANVQFIDLGTADEKIGVSFDITSRWTVTGNPRDRSMVRLLSYMLENEASMAPRSNALEWVHRTYSNPAHADPEIANALARVLRTDSHEGVRIRAIETLTTLPPAVTADARAALIEALRSDPNPAVRIKAVEALANMARSGAAVDQAMVDTLRQTASQDDENLYVRVRAAEALSSIQP